MSNLIFLIKPDDLKKLYSDHFDLTTGAPKTPPQGFGGHKLKGVLLFPSTDATPQPIFYFYPVYGSDEETSALPDIIIKNDNPQACPYPPGY